MYHNLSNDTRAAPAPTGHRRTQKIEWAHLALSSRLGLNYFGIVEFAAAEHGPDRADQVRAGAGFGDVSIATKSSKHGFDVTIRVVGKNENLRGRIPLANLLGSGKTTQTRHAQIHDHKVRVQLTSLDHGFETVGGLATHLQIILTLEKILDAAAHEFVIVRN
jgi:hypothetical protein